MFKISRSILMSPTWPAGPSGSPLGQLGFSHLQAAGTAGRQNPGPGHAYCIERIRGLGYTEDEARLLYIVANHSSYFVPTQFLVLTGGWGGSWIPKEGLGRPPSRGTPKPRSDIHVPRFRWIRY